MEKKNHLLSVFLYPLSLLYLLAIKLNKLCKKFVIFNDIKIVCVGNLYLGGTGKTPLVKKIYDEIKNKKKICVIKKYNKNQIDEIKYLDCFTDFITAKSRVKAIKEAKIKGYELAVLDDGMQDYSFKKNISILCIKSRQGFGNETILPAGPLRERIENIKKYNLALINGDKRKDLENTIKKYNQNIKIFYSKYKIINHSQFLNNDYLAFSGIGDNHNFFELLKENGIKVCKTKEFEDHYKFRDSDILNLIDLSKKNNLSLITTEKNFFNINKKYHDKINYVKLDLIINDLEKFINEID